MDKEKAKIRLLSRIKIVNECWEFQGATRSGYGAMAFGKKTISTHRLSWIIHNDEIPIKLLVCHKCDNRICVNPNHLFLGTYAENNQDKINKGRSNQKGRPKERYNFRRGKASYNAISDEKVAEIRQLITTGLPCTQIAKKINVSKWSVYSIKREKHYTRLK